ncbi:MAG: PQQ-binding-like beta-propeller repeat protein, partial [Verrucomicrobiota bacterium]
MKALFPFACLFLPFAFTSLLQAGDWPTYRHDNRRSGVTSEELTLPLTRSWVYQSPIPPRTAWTGPAKWDAYSGNDGLQSLRNFDPAFFVTCVGDQVCFGSSVDNAVHCLSAETGKPIWTAFTGAPVRLPPTLHDGRAYAGSDDGKVYCFDGSTGDVVWEKRAAPTERLIPNDGHLISPWPVRTGVLIQNGRAYFAASLMPWQTSYLYAADPATGQHDGEGLYQRQKEGVTLQGALLASKTQLYVPQGRAAPLAFSLKEGAMSGFIKEAGGVFCILTEDDQLLSG